MASVNLTFEGVDYTLTFNRNTVQQMESAGFNIEDVEAKPLTTITLLFRGSFLARHPKVSEETVKKIWGSLEDKTGMLATLKKLYEAPTIALLEEAGEDTKKISWTLND